MINNLKKIEELIEKIKNISKEDLDKAIKETDKEWERRSKMGYCNYFNCFCDDDRIEKEQDETGEYCDIDCQDCEWYEE